MIHVLYLLILLEMKILPTDTPDVQVTKQVQQQEWKKAKIAAFNQNVEKKTGNLDLLIFNSR